MRRNRVPIAIVFVWAGLASVPASAQQMSELPSWLEAYPGATATVRPGNLMVESSYTAADAKLSDVSAHYRKLFEAKGLTYQPSPDGIGASVRASTPDCDVLIQFRQRTQGTFVDVFCSAPVKPVSAPAPVSVPVISGQTRVIQAGQAPQIPADMMERHKRLAAEMGIGRQRQDQPAPPLDWPSWLTHVQGTALNPVRGVDQSKKPTLTVRYTTNVPMTEIRDFYRNLLDAHEYRGTSQLSTGHTLSGVQQNAYGSVDGTNYPDGSPGAHTVIDVRFDRSVLNGPITVTLHFTSYDYNAKRGY